MTRLDQILVKMGFDVSESSKVQDAMNKVNQETKKAGEGVAGFNTHGREMHELIGKIGEQSPIMGGALKAAFNPESMGIIILTVLIGVVVQQFMALGEAARKAAGEAIERWKAHNEAVSEAGRTAEEFKHKWEDIAEAAAKAKDPYIDQKRLLEDIVSKHDEILNRLEAEAIATAKGDKDQEAAIRQRFQRLREEAAATSNAARVTLARQQSFVVDTERDKAKEKADAAQQEIIRLGLKKPQIAEDRKQLEKESNTDELADAKIKSQEAQEELEDLENDTNPATRKNAAIERDKQIVSDYDARLTRIQQLTKLVDDYDKALKQAQEDAAKYQGIYTERANESDRLGEVIHGITDKATPEQIRQEAARIQKQMTATATGPVDVFGRRRGDVPVDIWGNPDRNRLAGLPVPAEAPQKQFSDEIKQHLEATAQNTKRMADALAEDNTP